jgi:hypothetical protein
MRRVFVGCAITGAFLFAVLSATGADRAATQAKAKAAKATAPPSYGNADAITQDELRVYEYFLASDQLEGRNIPSRGYDTAALYIASHLAEWGLKPGGSATGANGPLQPYFMPMEMVARQIVPAESKASLTAPPPAGRGGRGGMAAGAQAGAARGGASDSAEPRTTSFEYGKDWSVGGATGGRRTRRGGSCGRGCGRQPGLRRQRLRNREDQDQSLCGVGRARQDRRGGRFAARVGRFAACRRPRPGRRQRAESAGRSLQGLLDPRTVRRQERSAGRSEHRHLPTVDRPGQPRRRWRARRFAQRPQLPGRQVPDARGLSQRAIDYGAGIDLTTAVFQGEKLTGAQVFYAAGANAKQDSFELDARKKLSLHVAVHSEQGHGENVVGIVEGSDPV